MYLKSFIDRLSFNRKFLVHIEILVMPVKVYKIQALLDVRVGSWADVCRASTAMAINLAKRRIIIGSPHYCTTQNRH